MWQYNMPSWLQLMHVQHNALDKHNSEVFYQWACIVTVHCDTVNSSAGMAFRPLPT